MDMQPDPVLSDLRPRLVRLAYRMLGSVVDAEDVVQDAYARWLTADRDMVREPAAFLRTIVTRLCLNALKAAKRRDERYIGPWLPDPVFDPEDDAAPDDVTLPLMMALERLSPLERAAFLLHDVFGVSFAEVARTIGRSEPTCRKLASRARTHVHKARPRFSVTREEGHRMAAAFFKATREGDMTALRSLLAADVVAYADGGGKVPATPLPLNGLHSVLVRHAEMARGFALAPSRLVLYGFINGLPGFVTVEAGDITQTTSLQISDGRISAIYVMRNPDKLRHLFAAPPAGFAVGRE
ncbi:sigma-70 family RNA polymerase sigma factor [Azospirillum picis]|uniref:RNA polymerase sigma-70 factor (ECF subfamily) n=1 Tax=Azospirillum picis TaxID=488438 RepID=A0ABU0MRL4_9PROT|nr:sigma-70 family RNA polymerase sigma factor [Azospirillum picis]MBP2302177.1 RNA polymerase sigma-70 factor (ECF subfamily) [Azospirillum picis]MDQ0535756.1 RNA polymerase sigma-70 factor (ECF subfamily) [Azospirillum picis]